MTTDELPKPSITIPREERLEIIKILTTILQQYYTSHKTYLQKRALHYEAICHKRAQTSTAYFLSINQGIHKIVTTYQNTHGTHLPPHAAPTPSSSHTPYNIPEPRGYTGLDGVKRFLTALGLTIPTHITPITTPLPLPHNTPTTATAHTPSSSSSRHHHVSESLTGKRNSSSAGLPTPPSNPPQNRLHQPSNNPLITPTSSPTLSTPTHNTPSETSTPQPIHPPPTQSDTITLDEGIQIPLSQVYIAAYSLGHRLSSQTIKSLTTSQILRIFMQARQHALSTPAPSHVASGNLYNPTAPVGNMATITPPLYDTTGHGMNTGRLNRNLIHTPLHHPPSIGYQHVDNVSTPVNPTGISQYPGFQHPQSSATLQPPQQNTTPAPVHINPSSEITPLPTTPHHPSPNPPIGNLPNPPLPPPPPPSHQQQHPSPSLVTLRLQSFQQKYKVYLKLVRENLAALMTKRITGLEGQRYFRYMRYAIKLLTCPIATAHTITMEIIDKVESFLREYLVRYQGIALKRAGLNTIHPLPATGSAAGMPSNYAPNILQHTPLNPSSGAQQPPQVTVTASRLSQPQVLQGTQLMNSDISTALLTSSSSQHMNINHRAPNQGTANVAVRAVEAQREAVAQAVIRHARAPPRMIVSTTLSADTPSPPAPTPNLLPNVQPAPTTPPNHASPAENRNVQHSQIAKSVSRVNHYVRMAVHLTDGIEKNLENDRLLRGREERIAEACLMQDPLKREQGRDEINAQDREKSQKHNLMDAVKRECEEVRQRHAKLILNIDEEWKRPVVNCLLAFKSIRLPKMVVHVPATYTNKRVVRFGFERPPLGWTGIVGEVRMKFYSIRDGEEGVSELLEAWISAAEQLLNPN